MAAYLIVFAILLFSSVIQGAVGFAGGLFSIPLLMLGGSTLPEAVSINMIAATVQNASLKPGTIVDTVRRGYTWKDVVLRPAQVRAAAPETTPDEAEA